MAARAFSRTSSDSQLEFSSVCKDTATLSHYRRTYIRTIINLHTNTIWKSLHTYVYTISDFSQVSNWLLVIQLCTYVRMYVRMYTALNRHIPTILTISSVHSLLSAACCPISASMARLAITLCSYREEGREEQMMTRRHSTSQLTETQYTYRAGMLPERVHTYIRTFTNTSSCLLRPSPSGHASKYHPPTSASTCSKPQGGDASSGLRASPAAEVVRFPRAKHTRTTRS